VFLMLSTIASAQTRPTKVIGAGLGAAAKSPFHVTAGMSTTLSRDTIYVLTGFYYVDSLASLYIQPGTVIMGDSATNGTVIIRRGGKIYAEGSKTEPIVFTSAKPIGQRKRGDWGGIIVLGSAPTNRPVTQSIEGIDVGGQYGGSNQNDTSGVIRYVRIEFPGIVISLNNEINGLTLGGVGRGTKLEYIQVSYSGDDAFEFFGGTVDAKYLVAIGTTDDDFDSDYGFSGRIQFAFSRKDKNIWDVAGETNGFESDNDGTPTTTAPLTSPVFSNVTLVGPQADTNTALPVGSKFQYAAVIRRNTRLSIHNSVMLGFPWGLSLRNDSTAAYALQGNLQIRNVSLQARTNVLATSSVAAGVGFNFGTFFGTSGWNNQGAAPRQSSALALVDVFNTTNPDPRPTVGSEAATAGTDFSSVQLNSGYFTTVSYRGAFDPSQARNAQWDATWTNYDPNNTTYTTGVESKNNELAPVEYSLKQNYPNPFNPSTSINYTLPVSGNVTLKVFTMVGQEVATLVNGFRTAGSFEVKFDASHLSSGIYFYSLKTGNYSQVKKMMLLK
ncbi:MAG: T9SS type A sorting domain-containing protein, partial [Bacteriovoracaceae bacterium]